MTHSLLASKAGGQRTFSNRRVFKQKTKDQTAEKFTCAKDLAEQPKRRREEQQVAPETTQGVATSPDACLKRDVATLPRAVRTTQGRGKG